MATSSIASYGYDYIKTIITIYWHKLMFSYAKHVTGFTHQRTRAILGGYSGKYGRARCKRVMVDVIHYSSIYGINYERLHIWRLLLLLSKGTACHDELVVVQPLINSSDDDRLKQLQQLCSK